MNPFSDFTTPRKLICPISRHFFPVEQPEPDDCCTTGLKKGSRFPLIAHFFSSGLVGFGASPLLLTSTGFAAGIFGPANGSLLATLATGLAVVSLAAITVRDLLVFFTAGAVCALAATVAEAGALFAEGGTVAGLACVPAGAFAAGLADGVLEIPNAAFESLVFACCTVFIVLCTLLMMFGFCAQSPPVISPATRMPVVIFIAIPICSRPRLLSRVYFLVLLRPAPDRG